MKNNTSRFLFLKILFILSTNLFTIEAKCQFFPALHLDTSKQANFLQQIFDKQFNIYRLTNTVSISKKFKTFKVDFKNDYEGYLIRTNELSKKDGENLKLEISKNILPILDIFFQTNYFLNTDSKSIGLNEAEKVNNNLGMHLNFPKIIKAIFSYGVEKINQVSIVESGPRIVFGSNIDNISITNVNFGSQVFFEQTKLRDKRVNKTLSALTKIRGEFESNNSIYLALDFNSFQRDYIVLPLYLNNFFETRLENKLTPTFGLNYNIFHKTYISFAGQFNFNSIRRFYSAYDPTNLYSSVERTLYEYATDMSFELNTQTNYFSNRLGFSYHFRIEENSLDKKFTIDNNSFVQLSATEFQKNYSQTRLTLFGNFIFTPHRNNIINLSGNINILRYDTPSNQNDDDRDELTILGSLNTIQKFSKFYTITFGVDIQLNHLVFLKSTKSSLNNWNRIIKLSTTSNYATEVFAWKPTIEIFSNYLVYDFEMLGSTTKSYAFRQLVYKDTLDIKFSKNFEVANFFIYKFSERGNLFWNSFSMTKELEINEFFSRTMLYWNFDKKRKFGIGARIYNIKQTPKNKSPLQETYAFYSFSPETEIKISLNNNNMIFLQGWYELKFWNYKIVGENPNLLLTTKVSL